MDKIPQSTSQKEEDIASILDRDPKKIKKIATPYDKKETLGILWRNAFGINTKRNRNIVEYVSNKIRLNENLNSKIRIGFVGDIMEMNKNIWVPSSLLKKFFEDCEYLVGNFEATIVESTDKVAKGVIYSAEQRHDEKILDSLVDLFNPEKTYLSIANNHAGDFGKDKFLKSINKTMNKGFHVFGTKDMPFIDLLDHIRIVSGTKWTNQSCEYVVNLEDSPKYIKNNSFNILYPHWSNELELYPRPETIEIGKKLIDQFDTIIGHHSHVPQPICKADHHNIPTLIAYGLGDISTRLRFRKYHYGIALKFDIGLNIEKNWCIGDLEWSFTECRQITKNTFETVLIDTIPYLIK